MEDAATHEGLRRLSTTRGAGGVLDLFYDRWKLDLTLATPAYADAYRDLFEATYATNAGLWAHPYDAVAAETPEHIQPAFDGLVLRHAL